MLPDMLQKQQSCAVSKCTKYDQRANSCWKKKGEKKQNRVSGLFIQRGLVEVLAKWVDVGQALPLREVNAEWKGKVA